MHPMFKPLIAATLLCFAGAAAHAAKQDFTLYNNTGYTVDKVFVSSVGKKTWAAISWASIISKTATRLTLHSPGKAAAASMT